MKIRNGFVSNSSSSSFVVAFPRNPMNAIDVKEMMFGDIEKIPSVYNWDGSDKQYTTAEIAETVFADIKKQKANDMENITEGLEGWLKGAPEMDWTVSWQDDKEQWEKEWKEYARKSDEYRDKVAKEFVEPREDMFIYTFVYSDEDGEYPSTLEHGGIFDNLDHITVSRH